jgi:uncharacterized Zn finger protein (UPF0148 family)
MANMPGTIIPGTIVPNRLDRPKLGPYFSQWTNLKALPLGGFGLAILTCPGCGRGGLRVPDGRRGKVTCPTCGAEWFHPETIELSEVEFRCAQSGARFIVQLSRRSPLHKFVVQGIKNAPTQPSDATTSKAAASSEKLLETGSTSVPQLPKPRSGGWLAALFRKSGAVPATLNSTDVAYPTLATPAPTPLRHNASEYNWSSFLCPYCNASSFIRCSGGHLACDGTVEMRSERRFHQCYCGNAEFIEGVIETIDANQRTIPAEPSSTKFTTGGRAATTSVPAANPVASSHKEAVTQSQKISLPRTPNSQTSKLRDPDH